MGRPQDAGRGGDALTRAQRRCNRRGGRVPRPMGSPAGTLQPVDTSVESSGAREGPAGPRGGALLAKLSDEMVRAQKEYFGRGPTQAKSYLLDDFLLIVMRGGLTAAEKTMLDAGQEDQVRSFRQGFENEMTKHLTDMIEELTGRNVIGYQSQIIFEPNVVIEIFMFDDTVDAQERDATAAGQTEDDGIGAARGDGSQADPPSRG